MREEVRFISDQFVDIFQGQPWYGNNINQILQDVNHEVAHEKPLPHVHSIIEILTHMLAWRDFTLSKLRGDHALNLEANEPGDWKNLEQSDPVIWARTVADFRENQARIIDELSKWQDSQLDDVVAKRDYTFRFLLRGIMQHDLYHLGQIAILKKAISGPDHRK
jgi:uncharacterized damage-inducible protein DinB